MVVSYTALILKGLFSNFFWYNFVMPKRPYTKPHLKVLPETPSDALDGSIEVLYRVSRMQDEMVRLRRSQSLWLGLIGLLVIIHFFVGFI